MRIEDIKIGDFKMHEIYSQSMNWETGIMTTTDYRDGTVKEEQAMPPKSSMYYALKRMRDKRDKRDK